jgi:hypothetical protein
VVGFRDINNTTKDLKRQKMELELLIHEETMCYK